NLTASYSDYVGSDNFGAASSYSAGTQVSGIMVTDYNGDGIQDLLTNSTTEDSLYIQLGNGNGTFKAKTSFASNSTDPLGLRSGDFNGDGQLDVVTFATNQANIYFGNGDGTFEAAISYTNTGKGFGTVGDFNRDGVIDIGVENTNGFSI